MFINLTPHPVRLVAGDDTLTIPPSGQISRLAVVETEAGEVDGVQVFERAWGAVANLPEPAAGVCYIVSALVIEHTADRPDVLAPDTGATAVRDAEGRIVAARRLVRVKGTSSLGES